VQSSFLFGVGTAFLHLFFTTTLLICLILRPICEEQFELPGKKPKTGSFPQTVSGVKVSLLAVVDFSLFKVS